MQTNTMKRSWTELLGWYWAGGAISVGSWSFGGAVVNGTHAWAAADVVVTLVLALEILALVRLGRPRRRGVRVALVAGAITPAVLLGLLMIWLIWALSNYQF